MARYFFKIEGWTRKKVKIMRRSAADKIEFVGNADISVSVNIKTNLTQDLELVKKSISDKIL